MLTLGESVGLHDVEKSLHQVEQDPYGSRFVMGHRLVNSRRHITEIQLSRGWQSPRLRLQLEFAGRQKHPEQQDDSGAPHGAQANLDWPSNWGETGRSTGSSGWSVLDSYCSYRRRRES